MGTVEDQQVPLAWLLDILPFNVTVVELVDGEAVARRVNRNLLETTGYDAGRIVDQPLSSYQPDEVTHRFNAFLREVLETGEAGDLEVSAEVPTGRRDYRVRMVPLPQVGPNTALSLTIDRTEAARAEQALDETQALARLGHWAWNPAEDVITWSPQMWRIFGRDPDTFEAHFDNYLEAVHPDDRTLVTSNVEHVSRMGGTYQFRHRIRRPDGEVRILDAFGRAIVDDEGNVIRLAGTAQDVTEQVRLEAEAASLREANRLHEEGLELNDNVMQGLAVARLALMADDADEALRAIDRTMEAARSIISRLLDSRIEREGPLKPGSLVRNSRALEDIL